MTLLWKYKCPSQCWFVSDFGTKNSEKLSCIFMCFSLMSSNSLTRKNPTSPNKHVNKSLKSEILEFFLPYFATQTLIISAVLGSSLLAPAWHNRKHLSKAN